MSDLPPGIARVALEMMLDDVQLRLVVNPETSAAYFERGCLLEALGRLDQAKLAYRHLLLREPDHFGALNNLGILLYRQGFWRSAEMAWSRAAERHPSNPMGHAHLAKVLHVQGKAEQAIGHYEAAIELDPNDSKAHHGLAHVLLERGDEERGKEHQRIGMRHRPITLSEYRGNGAPVRVLVLGVAGEGNIPSDRYFDPEIFLTASLIADFYQAEIELPPHHVVFNVIGDADRCAAALVTARTILTRTDRPVLNLPAQVLVTGRAANSQRLGRLEGVTAAKVEVFARNLLERGETAIEMLAARGFGWPLLLRTPGFHTGQHFIKVDAPSELSAAVRTLPGESLMAIEYLEARGEDAKARKYRVMLVDGNIYPLHLAVSNNWKVHYFSADMSQNAEHRAEDARFLEDMPRVLGAGAMAALERIRDDLGLDYGGVDFALDGRGGVLLFEANATMIVPDPPAGDQWLYRRAPVRRIVSAVRRMLVERAKLGGYAEKQRVHGAGLQLREP